MGSAGHWLRGKAGEMQPAIGTRPLAVLLLALACWLPVLVLIAVPSMRSRQPLPAPLCACQSAAKDIDPPQEKNLVAAQVEPIGTTEADLRWVKRQLKRLDLKTPRTADAWHQLRKGINPRTRLQQMADLRRYKGISHLENGENRTALVCPSELLVEEHHSYYGEPWAGGRDVFEFLANASRLRPQYRVLEVGCGTLRVGLHFIRHLLPRHYHCLERDPPSLLASLMYELPAQGLLHKRPVIVRSEDLDITLLGGKDGSLPPFDLIYASAVFLHMPDKLVWKGFEGLGPNLAPGHGRLFVSHNIKFCTRLRIARCKPRLAQVGLTYVGLQTHDSLLFNHYELWHEFKRV